ncbi:PP2C family protein-serine/threonine phosphatase [Sphaerisporangium sp. TRM90804]|uniref:PP2C family protein-serine/threonine phosphatase n=1 Tax=Sphaerisporangium sp. TRM90804 TaxID=3031113 RepID=UPI00244B1847|nr:PP2C family protein-serine/threonine phosphatase [Sphaerisporangium sp. TRM90804]MDH2425245.1 PP2C family protein-serine/threonine phosphatase [Sphaerisporangium sp. TRM90804]
MRHSWRSGGALVLIPLALVAVISVADILAPRDIRLTALLVAAPAITASFAGPWMTGLIGVVAIAAQVLLDLHGDFLGTRTMQTQLVALVVVSAFLVVFSFLRDRHKEQLTRLRSVSEAAQRALLRPIPPRVGPLTIASIYLAADEEAQIGGDLYAVARGTAATRLVIGDVRGKGLPSVSDAALFLGSFREAARRRASLPDVVVYLEESVGADLEQHAAMWQEAMENFITAAVLEIPDDEPVIEMIDCGHPPPLLVRDHHVTFLEAAEPSPPLGLGELAEPAYRPESFPFDVGDTLLLYTDGVIEARRSDGTFYPLAERVAAWPGGDPEALVEHVRDDLLAYVGGRLGDDAAMVAIQRVAG